MGRFENFRPYAIEKLPRKIAALVVRPDTRLDKKTAKSLIEKEIPHRLRRYGICIWCPGKDSNLHGREAAST